MELLRLGKGYLRVLKMLGSYAFKVPEYITLLFKGTSSYGFCIWICYIKPNSKKDVNVITLQTF